jgi:hypothetical protein
VVLPHLFGSGDVWWLMALAGTGLCLAIAALVFSTRRAQAWAVMLSVLAILILVPTLTAVTAPRLSQIWISRNLRPMVVANTQPGDPPPALAGYEEPSLVFALGADVVLTNGTGAANAGAKSGGLALVEDQEKGAFLARLAELQADATPVGALDGFNYSRGRKVHIALYRMARVRSQ